MTAYNQTVASPTGRTPLPSAVATNFYDGLFWMGNMAITFDTHQYIKTLEESGISPKQAEAMAKAYKDAQSDQQPVTKEQLDLALVPLKSEIKELALLIKGMYVDGIFGFAVLGWICLQVFEISQRLPK